jgi:ribonuclease T2
MKLPWPLATAILAIALPAPALAQAYQCTPPRQIEPPRAPMPDGPVRRAPIASYILAASWSPEYCKFNGRRSRMQCSGQNGAFGFILHGLWPQAVKGPAPQWCSTKLQPSAETIRRNLCMTPAPSLLAREWAKHGSCMAEKPETYFKISGSLWRSLVWPDADWLSRRHGLTAGDLREEFVIANPEWQREQVGIETNSSGWLRGLRLCYSKDFKPRNCSRANFGAADDAPLKIWRGL